jgi:hypothetical protein
MLKQKAQEELNEEQDAKNLTKDEIENLIQNQPFRLQ